VTQPLSVFLAALLGLLAGSFLNVLIWRGPALWGLVGEDRKARGTFFAPRSYCPSCRAPIRRADLAPLLGFVIRRGRCRACGAPIPLRYPLVEAAGALAVAVCVAVYGGTAAAALAALYLLALIALAAIDLETGYLPDALTLPLIAAGLIANFVADRAARSVGVEDAGGLIPATAGFASFESALIGAAAGFAAFWALGAGYRALRRRDGLGLGDAKLLAGIGAWSGWPAIAPVVLLASVLALTGILVPRRRASPVRWDAPVRFGPALCAAAAIVFLGPKLFL
jgi:leader peptidase (prepilin peptidase)/N-methyltransferase